MGKLSFAMQQLKICLQLVTIKVHSPATANNYKKYESSEKYIALPSTVDPFKNVTAKKCDPRGVSLKCYM